MLNLFWLLPAGDDADNITWDDFTVDYSDNVPTLVELFRLDCVGAGIGEMRNIDGLKFQVVTPGTNITSYHMKWQVATGDTPTSPSFTHNTWTPCTSDLYVEDENTSSGTTQSGTLTLSLSDDGGSTTLATLTLTWSDEATP
jgi:hypothetical protein